MVLSQSQYKDMSKEELIQELTDVNSNFISDTDAKLTCLKSLMNLHQNMTKSIQSCISVKASYSPGSFSWSMTLLLILSVVEERQLRRGN